MSPQNGFFPGPKAELEPFFWNRKRSSTVLLELHSTQKKTFPNGPLELFQDLVQIVTITITDSKQSHPEERGLQKLTNCCTSFLRKLLCLWFMRGALRPRPSIATPEGCISFPKQRSVEVLQGGVWGGNCLARGRVRGWGKGKKEHAKSSQKVWFWWCVDLYCWSLRAWGWIGLEWEGFKSRLPKMEDRAQLQFRISETRCAYHGLRKFT